MAIRHYFLGANGPEGFHSLYGEFCPPDSGNFLWVIKGGPGCGKSTFMRMIGKAAEDAGLDVEYALCSSDPASLDGVLIPGWHVAYVDGTAPHTMDVDFPAASGAYLDLGSFYDIRALRPALAHLRALKSTHQALYREAYRALHEAKAVHDEIEAVYHPHVNFDGVTALAERHIGALKKQNADCNRGEIVV